MKVQNRRPHTVYNPALLLIAIAVSGLLLRLTVLPYAQFEADAVSRIYAGWNWLQHPHWIASGAWAPLHCYLLGSFFIVVPDLFWGPIIFQLLCTGLTVLPLYWFAEHEFGSRAALFACCAYMMYPVAFRYSLMPLSEAPFILFLLFALAFFCRARRSDGTVSQALAAGFFLTCAGAIRFEGWLFNLLLPLLMWQQWKKAFAFILAAAVFPVAWIASNYIDTGDALFFIHARTHWNLVVEALNSSLTVQEKISRAVFYPKVIFWGLTPLVAILSMIGSGMVIIRRKAEAAWLVPLLLLLAWMIVSAVDGTLICAARYSISISVLLLPFAGIAFEYCFGKLRGSSSYFLVFAVLIGSMLPLSYSTKVPGIRNWAPSSIEAVPKLDNIVDVISEQVNNSLQSGDALVTDFYGWGPTFHVALMTRLEPDTVFIAPGGANETTDFLQAERFFASHERGVLIIANRQSRIFVPEDDRAAGRDRMLKKNLHLKKLHSNELVIIYRYVWNLKKTGDLTPGAYYHKILWCNAFA
jgi:hypothetical protein